LIFIGLFFGFAPDLDLFYGFAKYKTWIASEDKFQHRTFLSHAPILWLVLAAIVYLIAPDPFWKEVGLLILVGSWTHFLLDSVESGIMWLWPFRTTRYALIPNEKKYITSEKRFFPFWINFVRWYAATFVTYKLEVSLILFALLGWLLSMK
jgi:membrane-bound metal-dependent hydrolase YbcI (DUF457 family)